MDSAMSLLFMSIKRTLNEQSQQMVFYTFFLSNKTLMYASTYQNKEIVNKSKDGGDCI
jgi:hypothetical protein